MPQRDISPSDDDARAFELKLRESEEMFRQVVENINEVFWMTNVEKTRVLYISPGFERVWGHSCQALYESPRLWAEAIHPEDRNRVLANAATRQIAGKFNEVYRIVRPDGSTRWICSRAFPVKDKDGEVRRIVGIAEDITEYKQAGEELRKSKEQYQGIFAAVTEGLVIGDLNGSIVEANPAVCRMLGYSRDEFIGLKREEWIHADSLPVFQQFVETAREGRPFHAEGKIMRKDGTLVHVEGHGTLFHYRGRPHLLGVVQDITERKKLEAQFLRAQRLENLGTLAAGIAHDLNNVLAPIFMSCDLLKHDARDETSQKLLNIIESSVVRGSELVRQIVSFARGTPEQRTAVQPRRLIREMAAIVRETFPKNIRTRTDLPNDLWLLSGDSTQLHQVLLNLCVNARDAMPEGGDLTIKAENVLFDEAHASTKPGARPGPYIVFKIGDTGTGIPPEIQEKIFEPFFTTKGVDKGTGLGLSTVLSIVKSHGGFISLNSAPGKGTAFEVWLPAQAGEQPGATQTEDLQLLRGHGEMILVVDDEAAVRVLNKQTLEAFGYAVLTAANGAEAIALYARHKDEIAVVLTDLMMPIVDGVGLVRALMLMNPAVRIITLSGSHNAESQIKAVEAGAKKFLRKPYTLKTLLVSVNEMLQNE